MGRADTVVAIATATGPAGIGVVRVSGPEVSRVIRGIIGRDLTPRMATLTRFQDAQGHALDQGIAIFFPAPASYTGEDVLELQGHGGPAVLKLVLRRCLELGARPAEPGEFTLRAYLNGKLDLAQAESVADLIHAGSATAAKGAMRSLTGEFSQKINEFTRLLVELRVRIESTLDFPEEGLDEILRNQTRNTLISLQAQLDGILKSAEQGRLLKDGVRLVLVGRPNVGKSSLMNRLAGEDLAIVTDVPGTTRDSVHHEWVIEGIPVFLSDTAGLRQSVDPVEKLGIERAWRETSLADVGLMVMDSAAGITLEDRKIIAELPKELKLIFIFNKIDITGEKPGTFCGNAGMEVKVSAKTGAGLDDLRQTILQTIGWNRSEEVHFLGRERHLDALRRAARSVTMALNQTDLDLLAEELRLAQNALSTITGEFSSEDLLGEIFARFCIGK